MLIQILYEIFHYSFLVARQMDRAHVEGTHQMGLVAPISLPFPQIDSSSQDVHPSRATGDSVSGQQTANKTADGRSPTEPGSILLPQVAEDLQKKYPNLMGPALTQQTDEQDSQQYGYQLQVPKTAGLVCYSCLCARICYCY